MNEIILGDAYKLIKDVPDKSVDLIVTDPPYLLEGWHVGTGLFKDRVNGYVENMMGQKENLTEGFDISILDEFVRVMKGINIYLWCNKEQIYDYLTYFVKERKCRFEIIVWAKANPSPFLNGHYLKDKEYCMYFWDETIKVHPKYDNGKTFYHTSVNMSDKRKYGHPTIKPEEIVRNLILNSSDEGGGGARPILGERNHLRGREATRAPVSRLRDKPEMAPSEHRQASWCHPDGEGVRVGAGEAVLG